MTVSRVILDGKGVMVVKTVRFDILRAANLRPVCDSSLQ